MRCAYTIVLVLAVILVTPHSSAAQGSIDGFGALSLNHFSSLDGSTLPFDFGGRLSYVEASAGIARVNLNISGFGAVDPFTRAALNSLDSTDPIAGVGGGVMFRGGPLLIDVGYRYKQIFADRLVGTLLSAGQGLRSHQVRFGMGVRF